MTENATTASKRGPGRPAIGKQVNVRLGDLTPRVDAWADSRGLTRADAVRELLGRALTADEARGGRMFEAHVPLTGETFRFRSLRSLAKRVGGDDYRVEHEEAANPPIRTLLITRSNRSGTHTVTRVRVPAEALADDGTQP